MTSFEASGRFRLLWQRAHTSLWFIPACFVVVATVLAATLLRTDAVLGAGSASAWWIFGGDADGARTVLSVIAGSLITVVAVAFSVTMIALQQASTQFTPRVLRNFTSDRGNQIVLGVYLATFTYSLLILRSVRAENGPDGDFVPSIAISTAMLLSLVSLGLLIYFIHHVATALQVNTVLHAIRRELDRELERLFPESLGHGGEDASDFEDLVQRNRAEQDGRELTVQTSSEGYLRRVDGRVLNGLGRLGARLICIEVHVGRYVHPGDVLLRAWSPEPLPSEFVESARGAFQLDRERSVRDDPLFGVRQLVDIGVKALSPAVADPTTAEQALDHLGGAIAVLLRRSIPSPLREDDGVRILFRTPIFADYVEAAFAQIRRAARADLHVTTYFMGTVGRLLEQNVRLSRAEPLRRQLEQAFAGFDHETLTDREHDALRRVVASAAHGSMNGEPLAH